MSNTELIGCVQHDCAKCKAVQDEVYLRNGDVLRLMKERDALQAQLAAAQSGRDAALARLAELEKQFADAAKQQQSVPEGWKQAVALAYGHLWHVNNEPMAPIPLRSSETAAYEARKQLRDLLTHEERGLAINQVQALLAAAPQPKETK